MPLRVVFMGTPEFAVAALARVRAAHEIIARLLSLEAAT